MSVQKTFLSVLLGLAVTVPAHAINVRKDIRSAWGYSDRGICPYEDAPEFILAGSLGKSGQHGTYGDEWAVVGMVARKVVAHGGYFCPYQVQCANEWRNKKAWTYYFKPTGYSESKCVWLCEHGYSGENCVQKSSNAPVDTYTNNMVGKTSGLDLKTSGKYKDQCESEVQGFDAWYQKGVYCSQDDGSKQNEIDVVLGVHTYLEHGVIFGPIRIKCQRDNWGKNDSFVDSVKKEKNGRHVLACAPGYEPNETKDNCVLIGSQAAEAAVAASDPLSGATMCNGFTKESFNAAKHYALTTAEGCTKFFCSQVGYAFPADGSFECTECATGVKGGAHPVNGQCKVCQTGQYFDKASGECLTAAAYSRTDMMYGKGKTRNLVPSIAQQCWPIVSPDDYKNCVVKGGAVTDDEESSGNSGGNSTSGSNPKVTPPAPGDRVPVGTVPGAGSASGGSSAAGSSGGSTGTIGGSAVVDNQPSLPVNNGFEKIQNPVSFQPTVRTPVKRKTVR